MGFLYRCLKLFIFTWVIPVTYSLVSGDPGAYRCSSNSISLPALDQASIDDLNQLQNAGVVNSVDLVKAYTQRTREVNHLLRAVSEINPDALNIAAARDAERKAGYVRGPLHGIPILLKDNVATCDRLNTTAGSYALLGARPMYEATVSRKLRAAGAIILGKATMGEWAQFRSSIASSSHGWSAYGGQTLGAFYPQQDPHGSSSGSAVAASVGLAAGALATETCGSIVNPAEKNNLVGIKPTVGLTSRYMVIPISSRQDSVGPVARTVKDAAYILSVLAGRDKHDNWTSAQPFDRPPDYVTACKFSALKGARLGVPRNGINYFLNNSTGPIMAGFENALGVLEQAGAYIEREANFNSFDVPAFSRNSSIVLDTDFRSGLSDYLSKLASNPHGLHDLEDLIRFTKHDLREEFPDRDIYVWDRELKRNFSTNSEESQAAYQANLDMAEGQGIIGALEEYDLDVLVMPTFTSFYLPAIGGLPIVTVPLGFLPANTPLTFNPKGNMITSAPGIPFGLAFVGRRWSEETLISFAYAFEQHTMIGQSRKSYIQPSFQIGDQILDPTDTVSRLDNGEVDCRLMECRKMQCFGKLVMSRLAFMQDLRHILLANLKLSL